MLSCIRSCLKAVKPIKIQRSHVILHSMCNEVGTKSYSFISCVKFNQKLLMPAISLHYTDRTTSFLKRTTSEKIWKSVTGVSNAGKQKGRARFNRRAKSKNLNRGQYVGEGNINMVWPGLNSNVFQGKTIVKQELLPPDPTRMEKLIELRNKMSTFPRIKLSPLERGYCGRGFGGRKIGPPNPILGESFEGFESIVIQMKFTCKMHGIFGRKRGFRCMVVTGNGKGLLGVGNAASSTMMGTVQRAKNMAGQNLFKINIEDSSIPGSFVCAYHRTKVFCERRSPGTGIRSSRVIAAICDVTGIKNLRAKIYHSTNPSYVAKAFIQGLAMQKSHQELADEKRLNIIDISGSYPVLVTKPKGQIRIAQEVDDAEELDVDLLTSKSVLLLPKKIFRPSHANSKFHKYYMKKMEHLRYIYRIKQRLFIEHGSITSFINEKYPKFKGDPFSIRTYQIKRHHIKAVERATKGKIKKQKDVHMIVTSKFHMPELPTVY